MRRREFLGVLGGMTAWPYIGRAQQATMPVVGFLRSTSLVPFASLGVALRQGLAEAGFVEGRNIAIESSYADNQLGRLPAAGTWSFDPPPCEPHPWHREQLTAC